MTPSTVGFIGLGNMGSRMCRNLLKAGFSVVAYDVAPQATAAAAAMGAAPAADLPTLARRVDLVISSLPDPAALLAATEGPQGLYAHLRAGVCHCDLSTVGPAAARRMHRAAESAGIRALDCPVSGGVGGAEAGTLTIMVGGEAAHLDAARPALSALGRNIVHCGGAGTGQAAKLVNQALVAIQTVAAAEALLVGKKQGLDLETMVSILRTSSGCSVIFDTYLRIKALAGDYTPGFAMDLMFKDLDLFVQAATEASSPAFLAAPTLQLYNAARAAGWGAQDQTAVVMELERLAGTPLGTLAAEND